LNSEADTLGIGGKSWIIESKTDQTGLVAGYDNNETIKANVPIGTDITATALSNGDTI